MKYFYPVCYLNYYDSFRLCSLEKADLYHYLESKSIIIHKDEIIQVDLSNMDGGFPPPFSVSFIDCLVDFLASLDFLVCAVWGEGVRVLFFFVVFCFFVGGNVVVLLFYYLFVWVFLFFSCLIFPCPQKARK